MKTREIPLTRGQVTTVDACWYDTLMEFKWFADKRGKTWYARRSGPRDPVTGYQTPIHMHRVIMGVTDPKVFVDHINGNGLDNWSSNLRLASWPQNLQNSGLQSNNTSGFVGVYWNKDGQKWRSCIGVHGRLIGLGSFDDPIEAARARDAAALVHHGPFARLNFPITEEPDE